ncbi:hypothetical protein GJAV_G00156410 [Gymnothorax javanicus]|nr:hypothetical protein GJAV_G00156410 [Gymnothorax javanicus]
MSAGIPRRIVKETQRLMAEPVQGIRAQPDECNARYFHVVIAGPQDSPFEGGCFKLELFLPQEYPMAAPKVRFMTKIYHPNVDKLGRICLDILKDRKLPQSQISLPRRTSLQKWSPALQIRTVLLSIQALLSAPNPDDPLANDVAELWKTNEELAIKTARQWTKLYAKPNAVATGGWTTGLRMVRPDDLFNRGIRLCRGCESPALAWLQDVMAGERRRDLGHIWSAPARLQ